MSDFPYVTNGMPEGEAVFNARCQRQKEAVALFPSRPLISILIGAEGKSREEVERTRSALALQTYAHFETLLSHEKKEVRGEWVVSVEAGDILSPVALFSAVAESFRKPETALFYSHEVMLTSDRKAIQRFFTKPRFSWFSLLHFNYLGTFWMVKKEWWEKLDGAAGPDFFLRLHEAGGKFELLPLFLNYRAATSEVSSAGAEVVKAHLDRMKIPAKVEKSGKRLIIRPRLASPADHLVSVIICFHNKADYTLKSLKEILRSAGAVPLEIFLVNNRSSQGELDKVKAGLPQSPFPITIIDYSGVFNFAQMHNFVVKHHCRGKYLLLLNNDVFWEEGTVEEMVEWASHDFVGTVGTCLRFPHGDVQHNGFHAAFGGKARMARLGNSYAEDAFTLQSREVFGSSFAACLVKRKTFDAIGGLRPFDLPNGYGDIAFNFDCLRRGLSNLYLGHISGVHLESATRGAYDEYAEECVIEREYPDILQRMLREDLGYDFIPRGDLEAPAFAREWALVTVREKLPWLKPLKTQMKKLLRQFGRRGQPS